MTPTLSSIIAKIEAAPGVAAQAEVLKKHSSAALKNIIGYAMDPGVKWLLPPGAPPYRAQVKEADAEGRLYNETKKFINLVDSPAGRALGRVKRERLFIQILEVIDPDDAKLMLRVKDKKLKIDVEAVKAVWPNLTKTWK